MQLPTQEQFVDDCLAKYRWEPIPSDQKWEEAHFPIPDCLGGEDTVMLWSADHTVQGLLQSVELDHQCFHGFRNESDTFNLTDYYPEYLPLFEQLKSEFSRRRGEISGKKTAELGVGVCGRSAEQMTADGKKGAARSLELGVGVHAPGMASKGGKIGGKKCAELKLGAHAPGMQSALGKKTAELKVGIHGRSAEQMTADGKKGGKIGGPIAAAITNAQKWQCLVTCHISTPAGLSNYQKKRGIDTKLRVKLNYTGL